MIEPSLKYKPNLPKTSFADPKSKQAVLVSTIP